MKGCLRIFGLFIMAFFVFIFFIRDNTHIHIHDYYYVDDGTFGKGVYLWTNPGYGNAPYLENLQSIQWNKQYIIAEQIQEAGTVFFIIKAGKEELMASNDSIYGPFTFEEKEKFLQHESTGKLKYKKFKYSSNYRFEYSSYVRLNDKIEAEDWFDKKSRTNEKENTKQEEEAGIES